MLLGYICPSRRSTSISRNAPTIVIPERQCITTGIQRSIDAEYYVEHLKGFFHHVFTIPMPFWREVSPPLDAFGKFTGNDVSLDTVKIYTYPEENIFNNDGLPAFLIEWEWRNVESPDVALNQMRKYYFHPQYIDDESDYSLVETLPKFKNSNLSSSLVFRAAWHPRTGFSRRDWVELIAVDEEEKTIISRSCIHPRFHENEDKGRNIITTLLSLIFPYDIIRAGCAYGCQLRPLKQNITSSEGCLVRVFFWYKMCGIVDLLQALGVTQVINPMIKSTIKQFVAMNTFYEKEKANNPVRKPDIDLL